MVEMLLLGIITLLCIVGICEFIYFIRLMFYLPKTRTQCYSLVVLKKEYAIKQLNYIWQKIKWQGDNYAVGIIALTDSLDCNELSKCNDFIVDKNIYLFKSESLD